MSNMEVSEIYKSPQADLTNNLEGDDSDNQFFIISPKKLVIMYILTMGLYVLVYFYQHWKAQKIEHDLKVNPILRSIFSIFFVHSLFSRIKEQATSRNIEETQKLSTLATIYVICSIVSWITSNIPAEGIGFVAGYFSSIAFTFLGLYPLYNAQKVANLINNDENGAKNSNFTGLNWFFMILGGILWLMSLLGVYASLTLS